MKDNTAIFKALDDLAIPKLENKEVPRPKLIVSFSAMPGSGKTTIALKLATTLRALYLENDFIRKSILEVAPVGNIDEINQILYAYLPHYYDTLQQYPNGLWVNDITINQYPAEFYEYAARNGFKTFIIKLDVEESEVKRRILVRGDRAHADTDLYLQRMKRRINEHQAYAKNYKADLVLGADARDHIDEIIAVIKLKLGRSLN